MWIFVAPRVLGFVGAPDAAWDHWIVGALVFVVSASAVWNPRGMGTDVHAPMHH